MNTLTQNWAGVQLNANSSPMPKAGSPIRGYSSEFTQQHHVVYISAANHVCELYDENGWKFSDLTQISSSPNAFPTSPLTGFVTSYNKQQHAAFIDASSHLRELYFDGTWKSTDLGENLWLSTPIAGYETGFNEQEHLIAIDANRGVTEFLYEGGWKPQLNITNLVNSKPPRIPSPLPGIAIARQLCAYSTEFDGQEHIIFLGQNDSGVPGIYELYFTEGGWRANNLTRAAGSTTPLPDITTALAAYPTEYNRQHHVIFVAATTSHVCELYYDGSSWNWTDLSAAFGKMPPLPVLGALTGYATGFNQQQHVIFVGATDGTLYEVLYSDGSWKPNNISMAVGPTLPAPVAGTMLSGYSTDYDQRHHVIFIGQIAPGVTHLIELVYSVSVWQWNDLTTAAVIPIVQAVGFWTVPTVSMPSTPASTDGGWESSIWIGIGGGTTKDVLQPTENDLLQAGTEQDFDNRGDSAGPTYYAWYEWVAPGDSESYIEEVVIHDFDVHPGDKMFCSIEYIENNSKGRIKLINLTTGVMWTKDLDPPRGAAFNGSTAEWIVEAPTDAPYLESLAKFTPVNFFACEVIDVTGTAFDPSIGTVLDMQPLFTPLTASIAPGGGIVNVSCLI